jgi:hypothetical protein
MERGASATEDVSRGLFADSDDPAPNDNDSFAMPDVSSPSDGMNGKDLPDDESPFEYLEDQIANPSAAAGSPMRRRRDADER